MKKLSVTQLSRGLVTALCLVLLGACGSLPTAATPPAVFYALEGTPAAVLAATAANAPAAAPTLLVNPTHAAAGFDSPRIIYVREPHKLEYFAHSEWVDPPARMLAPLLVATLAGSGAFRAVMLTPSAAAGDMRLDTEIVRLQHEFQAQPSRVRFTLRAYLVDDKTRRVLARRQTFFEDIQALTRTPMAAWWRPTAPCRPYLRACRLSAPRRRAAHRQ